MTENGLEVEMEITDPVARAFVMGDPSFISIPKKEDDV